MRYLEYVDIITTLANGSTTLFEATPEKYLVNQLSLQIRNSSSCRRF